MELQLRRNSRAILEVSEIGLRPSWRRAEPSAALGTRDDHAANEQQRRQIRELPMGQYSAADTHEGLPPKMELRHRHRVVPAMDVRYHASNARSAGLGTLA